MCLLISELLSRTGGRRIYVGILMLFITVAKAWHDPDSHTDSSGECSDLTPPILRYPASAQAANSNCKLLGSDPYLSQIQGITHATSDKGQRWLCMKVISKSGADLLAHQSSYSGLDTNSAIPQPVQNPLTSSCQLHQSCTNPWKLLNNLKKMEQLMTCSPAALADNL